MMNSTTLAARCLGATTLALLLTTVASAQTRTRPITDFTSKQGATVTYWPPVADYIGWAPSNFSTFALMDYAGVANRHLRTNYNRDLGTAFEGVVVEEPISGQPNDRLVTVFLHTSNALAFGAPVPDPFPGWPYPLVGGIGYRADGSDPMGTVAGGKPAALGDCYLYIVFVTHNNGGDLPDLLTIWDDILILQFVGNANGELRPPYPAGSKGTLHITQIMMATKQNPNFPVWTAEVVNIRQTGNR